MRRWWLVIALLLSLGLNLGILAAVAARRGGGPPRPRPAGPEMANPGPGGDPLPRLPRLADRLGLEGEQRRKFLDIQWNLYQETSRLRLQLGEVHREVRREATREQPDRRKIDQLLNESARIYLALERTLVKNVLASRDLLGPNKEKEYLELVGRLRVPNPGGGMGMQEQGEPRGPMGRRRMDDRRPGERLRDRRFRDRFGEGPPPRFEDRGPEDGGPPEGEGPPPPDGGFDGGPDGPPPPTSP